MTNQEQHKQMLLKAFLEAAIFDGWNEKALKSACLAVGISEETKRQSFPNGVTDLTLYYVEWVNSENTIACSGEEFHAMKFSERIRFILKSRIKILAANKESVRRLIAHLMLPQNYGLSIKALSESVDFMWKLAGDTSADLSFYTRRLTLGSVYSKVILYMLADESDANIQTMGFIDRQIDAVLAFGKFKKDIEKKFERFKFSA